jgi:iron(III) transport system permease protein
MNPTLRLDRAALALCLATLGAAVLYPIFMLGFEALSTWDWAILREPQGWRALVNTVVISFATVFFSALLGGALAWQLAHYRFPGRDALAIAANLPFALPPLVGVLSFYYLIGRDGFFPRLLEQTFGWQDAAPSGASAILLIHVYSFHVYFYAMLYAALMGMDRSLAEAARTLGAGPWRTFFRVTMPQLMPALVGASLLTFMSSVASFSAPYFFGGDFPMLSVVIFDLRSQFENAAALTLTVVLGLVAMLGVLIFRTRGRAGGNAGKGAPRPIQGNGARLALSALAWVSILLLVLPHAAIIWFAFADHRAWHTELLPTTFTLDNFAAIFTNPASFAPVRNSLWASALATIAVAAVALPAAYLTARRRTGGRLVHFLVMIPWAVPGTVMAMCLITAFNHDWLPLYNTVWLLPLAYFVRGVPMFTRMAAAAIEPFDASLVEAARTLGASPAYTARRVVLPLVAPAVAAAAAFVFASSLGEFVASILVFVPGNTPIAVHINQVWRNGAGQAFAFSVLLMLLTALTFAVARKFSARAM